MVHLHKNYTSRKKYNDIALLELTENVKYDNAVLPGNMPILCRVIKINLLFQESPSIILGNQK